MWKVFEVSYSLFFHSVLIISVYERGKKLFRAIKKYKETKNSSALKGEIFFFALMLILAIVLYKFMIYDKFVMVKR